MRGISLFTETDGIDDAKCIYICEFLKSMLKKILITRITPKMGDNLSKLFEERILFTNF